MDHRTPAYLQDFDYDVFLSYGWAGNLSLGEGDRAWVHTFVNQLEERLRTSLGRRSNIYLDARASCAGRLDDNLRRALESSALCLFAVSPGSCRQGSWCFWEVQHFLDWAKPVCSAADVMTAEDRLLKVVFEPVPREAEPLGLASVVGRHLFETLESGADVHTRPASFSVAGSHPSEELDRLVHDIARLLQRAETLRQPPQLGLVVFLASPFSRLNDTRLRELRRRLQLAGHRTVSATPIPGETEDQFRERTESALGVCDIAVHLLGDAPQTLPPGWTKTPGAWQTRYSLRRSQDNESFSIFLWEDPDAQTPDQASLDEVGGDHAIGKRDHHIRQRGFEYLESNLKRRLTEETKLRQGEEEPAGDGRRLVVIEFREEDAPSAAILRARAKQKGLRAQFAVPTGKNIPPSSRRQKNLLKYREADGLVVYFGHASYLWAENTCDDMRPFLKNPGVVALGPPAEDPPSKLHFEADSFDRVALHGYPDPDYDAWLDRIRRGG
jgi:hypothetical protein